MQNSNSNLFPRYLPLRMPPHEDVSIVGEVVNLDEHSRRLVLLPEQQSSVTINVNLPESFECAELRNAKYLQVRGMSEANGSVTMREYCNFKDNFDLKTYNEVLRLTNDGAFRNIFGIKS